jgi:hypothetical protein
MTVEKTPRRPPVSCCEGCKGWAVFNETDIQRCDQCWSGVPDAPLDEYFEAFSECQVELLIELVRGNLRVRRDKAEGWLRDVSSAALEELGYLVLPPEKAEIDPELFGKALSRLIKSTKAKGEA